MRVTAAALDGEGGEGGSEAVGKPLFIPAVGGGVRRPMRGCTDKGTGTPAATRVRQQAPPTPMPRLWSQYIPARLARPLVRARPVGRHEAGHPDNAHGQLFAFVGARHGPRGSFHTQGLAVAHVDVPSVGDQRESEARRGGGLRRGTRPQGDHAGAPSQTSAAGPTRRGPPSLPRLRG